MNRLQPQRFIIPLITLVVSVLLISLIIARIPEEDFWGRFIANIFGALNAVLCGLVSSTLREFRKNSQKSFVFLLKRAWPWWAYIVAFLFSCVLLFLLLFRIPTHYVMYTIDNSGSMGICKVHDPNTNNCTQTRNNTDEYPVTQIKDFLKEKFKTDKNLGYEDIPKKKRKILGREFLDKIKIGLIESKGVPIGETSRCDAKTLTNPEFNNREKLIESLDEIQGNDNNTTSLIKALEEADTAIQKNLNGWFNSSLSKNVVFFTDEGGENCGSQPLCDKVRNLPEDFNVKLHLITKGKGNCGNFQCFERDVYDSCIEVDEYSRETIAKSILSTETKIIKQEKTSIQGQRENTIDKNRFNLLSKPLFYLTIFPVLAAAIITLIQLSKSQLAKKIIIKISRSFSSIWNGFNRLISSTIKINAGIFILAILVILVILFRLLF